MLLDEVGVQYKPELRFDITAHGTDQHEFSSDGCCIEWVTLGANLPSKEPVVAI
jgi:hypothetical protein